MEEVVGKIIVGSGIPDLAFLPTIRANFLEIGTKLKSVN
jgi:hypothetical protein